MFIYLFLVSFFAFAQPVQQPLPGGVWAQPWGQPMWGQPQVVAVPRGVVNRMAGAQRRLVQTARPVAIGPPGAMVVPGFGWGGQAQVAGPMWAARIEEGEYLRERVQTLEEQALWTNIRLNRLEQVVQGHMSMPPARREPNSAPLADDPPASTPNLARPVTEYCLGNMCWKIRSWRE
ncbi:MAG: hypothetical protein O3B64_02385 [bacterium]|nr:hypothetical protein [bacterium]